MEIDEEIEKFNSVVIEGGDQIGKGDVTHHLLKKFSKERINVYKLSFPIYSSPFGTIVRKTLKQGFKDIAELNSIIETRREIELNMVGFALNRLEALDSILRRFKNKEAYFLLDRSPYSMAVTISYGLASTQGVQKDDVEDLIKIGFSLDQLFLKTLNARECIIHLMAHYGKIGWEKSRTDGDLYETKEVQEVVDGIYYKIAQKVGKGWSKIYTKQKGEFKKRREIYKEVENVVDSLTWKPSTDGKSSIYDILEIAQDIYGVDISELDQYKKYYRNIKEDDNEKNKETYELAYKIGRYISQNCKTIEFQNKEVKQHVGEILNMYPEYFSAIKHYYGQEFTDKLLEEVHD
jgi:thymidylate kinase